MRGVWPNVASSGATVRPHFEVVFIAHERTGSSIKGDTIREQGRMAITVVTEADKGEDDANDFADTLADLFPLAFRIPIPGGLITIFQPTEIRPGYRDGPDWRVPVIVKYRAITQ